MRPKFCLPHRHNHRGLEREASLPEEESYEHEEPPDENWHDGVNYIGVRDSAAGRLSLHGAGDVAPAEAAVGRSVVTHVQLGRLDSRAAVIMALHGRIENTGR